MAEGRRRYEVRVMMTGIVYTIDDNLSRVADVDLDGIEARLEGCSARTLGTFEPHLDWLRRAVSELKRRTGGLRTGTPIGPRDWHMRDLERMRRVVGCAAATLLAPPAR